MFSPAPEQFDTLARSKMPAWVRLSTASEAHRVRPHPNGTLSERSSPAPAVLASVSRSAPVLPRQDASDPKTAALAGLESAPACSRLAASNRLQGWAPKLPARATFGLGTVQAVFPLRKTPVDNLVKSGTAATPSGEHRRHRQRQQRTRANLRSRAPREVPGLEAPRKGPRDTLRPKSKRALSQR